MNKSEDKIYCCFHQRLKSTTNKLDGLMFTVPHKTRSLNNISESQQSKRQQILNANPSQFITTSRRGVANQL